ncbi:MAG: hypothetical protein OXT09_19585 [Myxococcales bacterium]|nr:hypothetical protein [Myxococcales bacterium]
MGGPKGLHGHGLRERGQLGPDAVGGLPGHESLLLRRYECQRCGAVISSAPGGLLPRLRYGAVAVALALALRSAEGLPGHRVRAQVSPLPSTGTEPLHGWRSLSRWARQCGGFWPVMRGSPSDDGHDAALEATRRLAAKAPMPTGRLAIDACAGAVFAMGIDPAAATVLIPPSESVAL